MNKKKEPIILDSDFIDELSLKYGIASGTIKLIGSSKIVKVVINPKKDRAKQEDYDNLIENFGNFRLYLTNKKLREFKELVTKEVTVLSYEQDDYEPTKHDYVLLWDDIVLKKITVMPDSFMLWYKAKKVYPKEDITMQINLPHYNVGEIMLY